MKRGGGEDNASAADDQRFDCSLHEHQCGEFQVSGGKAQITHHHATRMKYREDTERRSTYYPDKSESLYKRYVMSALQPVIDTKGKIPDKKEKMEASWGERG